MADDPRSTEAPETHNREQDDEDGELGPGGIEDDEPRGAE